GWLGVSMGGVSEALAKQLDIRDQGVVILNVVEGSPAERAGFEEHDIILSVHGEIVSDDIGKTVELIGSHAPGDRIDVVVLRRGDEKTLEVELATRTDMGHFRWKFDFPPLVEIEESVSTQGRMMCRDEDGNWTIKNLGDLSDWTGDASEALKLLLPEGLGRSIRIFVDGNRQSVTMRVKKDDGTVLLVEQEDGAEITVTRTDKDGQETTATYVDQEKLEADDPEAFELYERADQHHMIQLDVDGLDRLIEKLGEIDLDMDFDFERLHENLFNMRGELGEHFLEATQGYREAFQEAREAFQEVMEAFRQKRTDGQSEPASHVFTTRTFGPLGPGRPMFLPHRLGHFGKPKHTFTVRKDGTIEVRIRKGDSQLVQLFENEEDLAQRDPTLSRKYENLMNLDVED
ncbi:MAG: PDZ domain-containing protein, partial [Planctomycetes bacterium]|nr:PDZ domain-containing protein [Planctomycetota bacterium]